MASLLGVLIAACLLGVTVWVVGIWVLAWVVSRPALAAGTLLAAAATLLASGAVYVCVVIAIRLLLSA